jgi:hypothetical protein
MAEDNLTTISATAPNMAGFGEEAIENFEELEALPSMKDAANMPDEIEVDWDHDADEFFAGTELDGSNLGNGSAAGSGRPGDNQQCRHLGDPSRQYLGQSGALTDVSGIDSGTMSSSGGDDFWFCNLKLRASSRTIRSRLSGRQPRCCSSCWCSRPMITSTWSSRSRSTTSHNITVTPTQLLLADAWLDDPPHLASWLFRHRLGHVPLGVVLVVGLAFRRRLLSRAHTYTHTNKHNTFSTFHGSPVPFPYSFHALEIQIMFPKSDDPEFKATSPQAFFFQVFALLL